MIDIDLEKAKATIRTILEEECQGPDDCIRMAELFVRVTGSHIIPMKRYDQTRFIRTIVKELREEGCPIGNKAGNAGGYFWASNDEELKNTIENFHHRAMSSLKQEAALRRISFNQLLLELEDEYEQEKQNAKAA